MPSIEYRFILPPAQQILPRKWKIPKRNIGQEILDDLRDVKAHKAGKKVLRIAEQKPDVFMQLS